MLLHWHLCQTLHCYSIAQCGLMCIHTFLNILFPLYSVRDLYVLKLPVIQVPVFLKRAYGALGLHQSYCRGPCFVDLCLMKVTTQSRFGH